MPEREPVSADERRRYRRLLVGITIAGLILRVISLNSDLWLDEVASLLAYDHSSFWQTIVVNSGFSNHLLNTLSVKAAIGLFGEREWVVRLPAMLWGTATIPVFYRVARKAFSRRGSLAAALLLTVSYHHIFFSQNSRGYTAYLCLSLASTVLLIRALRADAVRTWIPYIATSALNPLAHLIGAFVVAGQAIVAAAAGFLAADRRSWRAMAGRLLLVYAVIAALSLLPYAPVLSAYISKVDVVYGDQSSGFPSLSLGLLLGMLRGLVMRAGLPLTVAAVPVGCALLIGYLVLLKRRWILTLALTLPCLLEAIFFDVLGYIFYPRLFMLALPLAILVAVQTIELCAEGLARAFNRDQRFAGQLGAVAVMLLCVVFLTTLPRYYRVPKQPNRASLSYIEHARGADGIVIVILYAEGGIRYYLKRDHAGSQGDYFYARTVDALDAVLASHPGRPAWLMTTFSSALHRGEPALDTRIRRQWEVDRSFDATVGDGEVLVWRPR